MPKFCIFHAKKYSNASAGGADKYELWVGPQCIDSYPKGPWHQKLASGTIQQYAIDRKPFGVFWPSKINRLQKQLWILLSQQRLQLLSAAANLSPIVLSGDLKVLFHNLLGWPSLKWNCSNVLVAASPPPTAVVETWQASNHCWFNRSCWCPNTWARKSSGGHCFFFVIL